MYTTKYRAHVKADIGAMSLHKDDPYTKEKKASSANSRFGGRQFKGGPSNWEKLNKIKYVNNPYASRLSYLNAEKSWVLARGTHPSVTSIQTLLLSSSTGSRSKRRQRLPKLPKIGSRRRTLRQLRCPRWGLRMPPRRKRISSLIVSSRLITILWSEKRRTSTKV